MTGLDDIAFWQREIDALGVGPDAVSVVLDDGRMTEAARVWFILQYFGLPVALLNGGCPALADIPSQVPRRTGPVVLKPGSGKVGLQDRKSLRTALQDVHIFDARSAAEFNGTDLKGNARGRHLPGAAHLPHDALLDGSCLRSGAELAQLLDAAQIDGSKPVVSHCNGGGRAALAALVVTTATESAAHNFNLDQQHPHAFRYRRAAEHVDVVKKLWDSFEDDAFIRDKESGRFFDPEKVHYTDHRGEHFKVRGPLNVSRSAQGHPVIVQAGQSDDGRGLAAATAEVIFTAHQKLDTAQEFYRDIKARARGLGRNPDHILIMPGVSPFVGRTESEAREKYERLTSLILEEDGIALIKGLTGGTLDLTGVDLDGPLPPVEPTEGMKSRQALIRQIADENGFTIRQLYQHVASARGHFTIVGSPSQIVDVLEDWFQNEGADGFNILPPWLPTGLTDFVDLVIPELQRRGLFRTEYEGRTLRENLGLPFPETRWALSRRAAHAAE